MDDDAKLRELADLLQQARRSKHLSIRKVSGLSSIPETTIRSLENPRKSQLPLLNLIGLYRAYADALGVPKKQVKELIGKVPEHKADFLIRSVDVSKPFIVFKNIGLVMTVGAIVLIITAYVVWQGSQLLSPPDLKVSSPASSVITVYEPRFTVRGVARIESSVLINGMPTAVDANTGEFEQVIYLQPEHNILNVEVVNSFSSSSISSYTIFYDNDVARSID